MTSHYVVEMRVIRVDHTEPKDQYDKSEPKRVTTEIVRHVVKGDEFEKTVEKAQAYLALAEDLEAIDPMPKGNTR